MAAAAACLRQDVEITRRHADDFDGLDDGDGDDDVAAAGTIAV